MFSKTYKIEGMSCDGCRKYVEKILSTVDSVTNVSANQETGEAIIEMKEDLSIDVFKKVFHEDGDCYQIEVKNA